MDGQIGRFMPITPALAGSRLRIISGRMPMSISSQIIMETLTRGTGVVAVGARVRITDSASMETMVDLCGRVRTEGKG